MGGLFRVTIIMGISIYYSNSYISWASRFLGEFGTWTSSGFVLIFFIIPYIAINLAFLLGWVIHLGIERILK